MTTEHQRETTPQQNRAKERRAGSQELVQKLVAERTEMLSLYCQLAGLEPYGNAKNSRAKHSQELLQKFCQVLVDYIAAGHFSLYERVVNGTERRQQVSGLAEKLYPRIAKSTEVAATTARSPRHSATIFPALARSLPPASSSKTSSSGISTRIRLTLRFAT
jgi:regulator of sigma D